MPGYRKHLQGGVVAFALGYIAISHYSQVSRTIPGFLLLLASTLFGSLFPDLDVTSKIQRIFYRGTVNAALFLVVTMQHYALLFLSLLALFIGLLRHRTLLHDIFFVTLFPCVICYSVSSFVRDFHLVVLLGLFFIFGAWSHLFLDFGVFRRKKKRKKA